jgi:hypothetical protein
LWNEVLDGIDNFSPDESDSPSDDGENKPDFSYYHKTDVDREFINYFEIIQNYG